MSSTCPTHGELASYTLGKLPRERCEEIDMHLDECVACLGELETCGDSEDTFLSRLREPKASESFLLQQECAELLDRVIAIGQEPSRVTQRKLDDGQQAEPALGDIGPYRLLAKLGAGGMGTVYKAFHTRLKRIVALKMLPTDRVQDQQAVARFEREMEAVGQLMHPNIVLAHDAGEHDHQHFLVMEHVEGIDLSELSRRDGPLPIADACELIRQAAIGLQHAHEHGLVHRDIKPSNLMLTPDGATKLLDLGLALLPDQLDERSELTSTGQAMGTLDYMAPEQGGDSHEVDIRADIYALGATLYKLLTGQAIYAGPKYKTVINKWRALATEDATPIQSRRAEISNKLAAVVHRMLARDVEQRYATPHDVAKALEPFCQGAALAELAAGRAPNTDEELSQSTTSLLKEAGALDTASKHRRAVDPAPTESLNPKADSATARRRNSSVWVALGLPGMVALAAAMVFYFQTPHGALRVEISDPGVEVRVKGEDIVLTGADEKPIKLKAGKHTLIVTRGDDFTFETKQLILKKGETTTVKVELLPDKVLVVSERAVIGQRPLAGNDEQRRFALEFDGTDDYVQLPFSDITGPTATFEAIVRIHELRDISIVIGNPQAGGVAIECIGKSGKEGWAFAASKDGYTYLRSGRPPQIDRYTHIAGVVDNGSLRFYIDGRLVAQDKINGTVVGSKLPFCLGTNVEPGEGDAIRPGGQFLCGQIKLVRVSRTARYKTDFAPVGAGESLQPDNETVALYHFDEGSGDVLRDSSGNGHHGKIVGAKWVKVDAVVNESAVDDAGQNESRIGSMGAPILAEPVKYEATEPLNRHCLTPYPAPIEGVRSWTVATKFHRGAARQMHFSPDGKYLAYLADGALRICDGETFEPVRSFMRPRMREIAWLPDSRTISLATATDDETATVHVWRVEDGSLQRRIDLPFRYPFGVASTGHAHLAWSGDRRLAIARGDTQVLIYDWAKDAVIQQLAHRTPVANVAWSPDDAHLAVSSYWREAATAYVWDARKYELLHTLDGSADPDQPEKDQYATAPLWCCDGKLLAVAFRSGAVVWDPATGERKLGPQDTGELEFVDWENHLLPSPQSDEIVAVGKRIWIWNLVTGDVQAIRDTTHGVGSIACHPTTGRLFWSNEWSEGNIHGRNLDGSYDVRDVMQRVRRRHGIPDLRFRPAVWSEDISHPVVRGGIDEDARMPFRGRMIATPDGELAAVWQYADNTDYFTVARDGLVIGSYPEKEDRTEKIWQLALEADGSSVAAIAGSGTIRAWELPGGTLLGELQAPDYEADPELNRFFIASDRRCVLVDEHGQMAISKPNFQRDFQVYGTRLGSDVAISPDGKQLAFYTQSGVQLFDPETLKRKRLPGVPGRSAEKPNRCIAWRNGNTLALYTESEQVVLYDVASGKLLRSYPYPWVREPFSSTHHRSHFGTAGRYFVSRQWGYNARLLDTTNGWVESIVRYWDAGFLHVGATGHYDASENIAPQVIYVVELENGDQLNLSPRQFSDTFGWTNDPAQAGAK